MRHFGFPRLEALGYYAVFCDCGAEIRRFDDEPGLAGKEKFQQWLARAELSQQYCGSCYSQQLVKIEVGQFDLPFGIPASLRIYLDELSEGVRGIFDEVVFPKASLNPKRE